jgi:acetyl esterase/lipase
LSSISIHVGTDEMLLDDSTRFARRAQEFGVEIKLEIWPGMLHAFPLQAAFVPEARQAIETTAVYMRDMVGLGCASKIVSLAPEYSG